MPKKPRRANLKEPGKCIFCGAGGLTHEHMWADWLRQYIPRNMTHHTTRKAEVDQFEHDEVHLEKRAGDPHSRHIYCVCKPCNSGWMSALQTRAKPHLIPMLTNKPVVLYRNGQTALAAWSSMMIMAAEFVNRDHVSIPQCDRDFLRERQKPPSHWRLWLGAHVSQAFPLYTHNVLDFAEKGTKVPHGERSGRQNTHTTTICVGDHLLIFAMSSIPARSLIRRWILPGEISPAMQQIWPIISATVVWPDKFRLNDCGLGLLADDFLRKAMTLLRTR